MDDAKQEAFFVQLWDRTGLHSALCCTTLGALAGVDAISTDAAELSRNGAGRVPKGLSNLSASELLKMEAGESHTLFWLDLLIVIGWINLHLLILQVWQVLHITFE
jgi:hypothetical protein